MYSLSTPLSRALGASPRSDRPDRAFSQSPDFAGIGPSGVEPTGDGCFGAGQGGIKAPAQLMIVPYSRGYGEYLMRLWGWYTVGEERDTERVLWLPLLLAEFSCVSGGQGGLQNRVVGPGEMFCGDLKLDAGSLGQDGRIFDGPVSWAKVDLQGCRKFQFDFTAPGNALWGLASSY